VPGCEVLTIGPWCVEHDLEPRPRTIVRGRPFPPVSAALTPDKAGPARSGRLDLDGWVPERVPELLGTDRAAVAQPLDGG
jgi:hypothetical protein